MMRRRRGVGLLGTMAVGGLAYAAGNSAAKNQAREADQNDQIAYLQAQAAQQQAMHAPPPPPPMAAPPAPAAAAAPPMDPKIAQLRELAELKTAGVLTEEEFAAQKARILNS